MTEKIKRDLISVIPARGGMSENADHSSKLIQHPFLPPRCLRPMSLGL
jgi:hypothetical protein